LNTGPLKIHVAVYAASRQRLDNQDHPEAILHQSNSEAQDFNIRTKQEITIEHTQLAVFSNTQTCPYLDKQQLQKQHQFNGPLSGTTWVSQYQKGKNQSGFTGARDSEWQRHQMGHMQMCTLPQTAPHHSVFNRSDDLTAAQPIASKH